MHPYKSTMLMFLQPRSQGLSSPAPGGGKMRDPGNEINVSLYLKVICALIIKKRLNQSKIKYEQPGN